MENEDSRKLTSDDIHSICQPLNVMKLAVGNLLARYDAGTLNDDPEYLYKKLVRIDQQITTLSDKVHRI